MNELIKVNYDSDNITVSARELHEFLEVKTEYKDWFPRMCEYGFTEGIDFRSFLSKSTGGRPAHDAEITLDMAKELAMIQRTPKGKEARQYFIQLEKNWNSPEKVMARALQIADQKIKQLTAKIELDAPKVQFAERLSVSDSTILVRELATLIQQNGVRIGQNDLYEWLRDNGYVVKRKGTDYNTPTKKSLDLGVLVLKEDSIPLKNGSTILTKTTKVTVKGQQYFLDKLLSEIEGQRWKLRT